MRGSHPIETAGPGPKAFTLVEVMVVVVIIGLLAAAGLPGYRHLTMRSKATTLENDLRQFSTAIQTYTLQNGRWPASFDSSSIPADLASALPAGFAQRSPIGGVYKWNYDPSTSTPNVLGVPGKAGISVETVPGNAMDDDVALLEMVDRQMDDGVLTSGLIQDGPSALVFVVEK